MNAKQQRFVEEYLIDLNATQAALRAGYSPKTAYAQGHDLLKVPEVAAAVAEGSKRLLAEAGVQADAVLRECAALAFSDVGDILDFSGPTVRLKPAKEIPPHARRCISSIKVKRYVEGKGRGEEPDTVAEVTEFKLWSKDAAQERLGKYLKLFTDRVEHTGPDGGGIEVVWGSRGDGRSAT
jgi:phage terminase small subunit